jgi:hypothetical protein
MQPAKNNTGKIAADEAHGIQPCFDIPLGRVLYEAKILLCGPDWQDQSTTRGKLLKQCRRHTGPGSCHDDTVKWSRLGQPELAIGVFETDVELLQGAHVGLGFFEQRREALNRINLVGQLGQHGSLVTATSANLQRLAQCLPAVEQQFDHARHDVGLRDGLPHAER